MISRIAFVFASLMCISTARADGQYSSPGVTMELCGDVDIDEVQEAIATEYQGEDDSQTMVTIACRGSIATVRVIGPSHPRGRIVDLDLTGIDAVALPRTIALMAVELWTAPQASATPAAALAAPGEKLEPLPRTEPSNRKRFAIGAGVSTLYRDIHAGRTTGSVGATGTLAAWSLRGGWRIFSRLGVFFGYQQSIYAHLDGLEDLGERVRWRRSEIGLYVPLVREPYRLTLHISGGEDQYSPEHDVRIDSEMTVLPDYRYQAFGLSFSYPINSKLVARGWGTAVLVRNRDDDFSSPRGRQWGAGLSYDATNHVRFDGKVEAGSVSERSDTTRRSYSDATSSIEFGIQLLY